MGETLPEEEYAVVRASSGSLSPGWCIEGPVDLGSELGPEYENVKATKITAPSVVMENMSQSGLACSADRLELTNATLYVIFNEATTFGFVNSWTGGHEPPEAVSALRRDLPLPMNEVTNHLVLMRAEKMVAKGLVQKAPSAVKPQLVLIPAGVLKGWSITGPERDPRGVENLTRISAQSIDLPLGLEVVWENWKILDYGGVSSVLKRGEVSWSLSAENGRQENVTLYASFVKGCGASLGLKTATSWTGEQGPSHLLSLLPDPATMENQEVHLVYLKGDVELHGVTLKVSKAPKTLPGIPSPSEPENFPENEGLPPAFPSLENFALMARSARISPPWDISGPVDLGEVFGRQYSGVKVTKITTPKLVQEGVREEIQGMVADRVVAENAVVYAVYTESSAFGLPPISWHGCEAPHESISYLRHDMELPLENVTTHLVYLKADTLTVEPFYTASALLTKMTALSSRMEGVQGISPDGGLTKITAGRLGAENLELAMVSRSRTWKVTASSVIQEGATIRTSYVRNTAYGIGMSWEGGSVPESVGDALEALGGNMSVSEVEMRPAEIEAGKAVLRNAEMRAPLLAGSPREFPPLTVPEPPALGNEYINLVRFSLLENYRIRPLNHWKYGPVTEVTAQRAVMEDVNMSRFNQTAGRFVAENLVVYTRYVRSTSGGVTVTWKNDQVPAAVYNVPEAREGRIVPDPNSMRDVTMYVIEIEVRGSAVLENVLTVAPEQPTRDQPAVATMSSQTMSSYTLSGPTSDPRGVDNVTKVVAGRVEILELTQWWGNGRRSDRGGSPQQAENDTLKWVLKADNAVMENVELYATYISGTARIPLLGGLPLLGDLPKLPLSWTGDQTPVSVPGVDPITMESVELHFTYLKAGRITFPGGMRLTIEEVTK